jgi:hypothetical protein
MFRHLFVSVLLYAISIHAHEITAPLTTIEHIAVGSAAGLIESVATQPLVYLKTRYQLRTPVSRNPLHWWQGWGAGAVGMTPTTGAQTSIDNLANAALKDSRLNVSAQALTAASVAGGASAAVLTPIEMITLHRQNGLSYKAIKARLACAPRSSIFRAITPTIGREAGATAAWIAGPEILIPALSRYMHKEWAEPCAYLLAGGGAAIATHPFDVIKTRMQDDLNSKVYKSTWQSIQHIHKTEGAKAFVAGLQWRLPMLPITTAILYNLKKLFTEKIQSNKQ